MEEDSSFRPGTILNVRVCNFVTYTTAEMVPGPYLNMIIGPNGTGKSTMVAAIILGLGGSPKHVGRGTRISEYVKHHCTESRIDITLYNSNGNVVITREFDINDKTTWKINDKRVSLKEISECKEKFNIQVDNLCQFLPQDRVQEFSKLNKQELLKQTQSALCRNDLEEKQMLLIKAMDDFNNHQEILEAHIKKLQEAKDANVRLAGKVQNFNTRKKYLGHIHCVDRKIAWKEYEDVSLQRRELIEDKEKAKKVFALHKNSAAPTMKAIASTRDTISLLQNQVNDTNKSSRHLEEDINTSLNDLNSLNDSISILKRKMNARLGEMRRQEEEIQTMTAKLNALQGDKNDIISQYGGEANMKETLENHSEEIKKFTGHLTKLEEKKSEFAEQKREKVYQINSIEREVQMVENIKEQRLAWLRQYGPDAHRAVIWLKENQQNFVGKVYNPMMLELNAVDPKYAIYLENVVAYRDKIAFLCTDKADMNLLIRILREQEKFSVNILHCEDGEDGNQHLYQPAIPIEHLRKCGMYAYLNTLVTGPTAIMKYLCQNYRIHEIPIGDDSTNKYYEDVPAAIRCFYSDKYKFSISYSKYTNTKSSRQNEIQSDGSFSISVDTRRMQQFKSRLDEIKLGYTRLDNEETALSEKIAKINELMSKVKDAIQDIRRVLGNVRNVDSKIRVLNQTVQQIKSSKVTEEDIKVETAEKIEELVVDILEKQPSLYCKLKDYNNFLMVKELCQIKMNCNRKRVTYLENQIIDIRRACEDAEKLVNELVRKCEKITTAAKAALQKAKALSNGFTPADEGFSKFREAYDRLPDTVPELETEKNHLQNKIECLTTADEDEMEQYETRVKLIETLEQQILEENLTSDSLNSKIGNLEKEYTEPLQELIEEINHRFGVAFERMGCAGEVSIYTGNNLKDYINYGISIKVTYRNGEPMQELNSVTQSGGEKAVATAIYMLSLQDLTPVPFRCVDEINQGMDETNERRIFALLTDLTSRRNTAQYFFITPKLISKLQYVPTMKIHFVHNGPFTPTQMQWNTVKV